MAEAFRPTGPMSADDARKVFERRSPINLRANVFRDVARRQAEVTVPFSVRDGQELDQLEWAGKKLNAEELERRDMLQERQLHLDGRYAKLSARIVRHTQAVGWRLAGVVADVVAKRTGGALPAGMVDEAHEIQRQTGVEIRPGRHHLRSVK